MSVDQIKREIGEALTSRAKHWEAAKAIRDRADEEKRPRTAEEEQGWDKAMAEMRSVEATVERLEADLELEERNVRYERERSRYRDIIQPDEDAPDQTPSDGEAEFREWLQGKRGRTLDIDFTEKMVKRTHTPTGRWEVRDLVEATTTAGGHTVPTGFVRSLYEHLIENSAIRQTNVTVYTTASGENLPVPKTTTAGTAAIVGEGTALAENDPLFGQVTLGAWKYGQLIQVSNELITDTAVDLLGFIARDAGRALGNASGAHFCTGTGSAQPNGVFTAAGTGVTGATGGTGVPSADNLIDLFYSVIPPYRRNAFWLMADGTVAWVRKLKETTGQYIWQPGLQADQPDRLLGRPVVTEVFAPAMGTGIKSIAFGDFSAYAIRDVGQVRFERSDDFAFSSDMVTYRSIIRTDGDLVDLTGAIKLFRGGTS